MAGATAAAWQHFARILGPADLLPVVLNPAAHIHPASSLTAIGAAPSRYDDTHQVVGIAKWPEFHATELHVEAWSEESDYGIAIQTRAVHALYFEGRDLEAAGLFRRALHEHCPDVPLRIDSSQTRVLGLFTGAPARDPRTGPAGAAQFVAWAVIEGHLAEPWEWVGGWPQSIPLITEEQLDGLWRALDPPPLSRAMEALLHAAAPPVTAFEAMGQRRIPLRRANGVVAARPCVRWLLQKVLEQQVLAVMAGPRSTYKSFLALDWAMRVAQMGKLVVMLSGEGSGLGLRIEAWMRQHGQGVNLDDLDLFVHERALNLTSGAVLDDLVQSLDDFAHPPALIVIDTLSKFSAGLDENDNTAVALFLARLSESLRDRYGATVLLVAHSGHSDSHRPRGASALMANPDAEYVVDRPAGGPILTVTRDRYKDSPSLEPLTYEAVTIDFDRTDAEGDPVTSLVLVPRERHQRKAKPAGKNQDIALAALRKWSKANPGVSLISRSAFNKLLAAGGIPRQRRYETASGFVRSLLFVHSDDGWVIDLEQL